MSKKTTVRQSGETLSAQNLCDHCGTVTKALTLWQAHQIADCGCACHQAASYDRMKKGKKKRA